MFHSTLVSYIINHKKFTRFIFKTENSVELITSMGIPDLPNGVNETAGMCQSRNSYQTHKAPAYSINKGTMITLAASDVILEEFILIFLQRDFCRFSKKDFPSTFRSWLSLERSKDSQELPCFQFITATVKNL